MAVKLVPLGTVTITLAAPIMLPKTPKGTRAIVELEDVKVTGERLSGTMKGHSGADWALIGPDGTTALDVRFTIETGDGALIFVQYVGRADFSKGPGSAPIYTAPVFETGDERYSWLNKIQTVAKGIMEGNTLTYEVYEVR